MTPQQILSYYKDDIGLAATDLCFSKTAIKIWLKQGRVPFRTQQIIEMKTDGALVTSIKDTTINKPMAAQNKSQKKTVFTCYKCYDKFGDLVYVGSTINIVSRLSSHKSASPWYSEVEKITLSHFKTKRLAYAEEIKSVVVENPKFNKYLR